jgi:arsenate reductase
MDDPARARKVIQDVFRTLHRRINLFTSLPVDKLDQVALQTATRDIGKSA